MTVLVVGATGATGALLVKELLGRGQRVRAVVRSPEKLLAVTGQNDSLTIVQGNLLEFSPEEMVQHLKGCTAVASCLGHNPTLKGLFGSPKKLVTDATRILCEAVRTAETMGAIKFVLMNTAGNSGPGEQITWGERCVVGLIRHLVPPHADNEQAAEYLQGTVGTSDPRIEWSIVRPDTLIDESKVNDYEVQSSPVRSAIFNAGKTSRNQVAHFMADLITDDTVWGQWKSRMPVIYTKGGKS